MTRGQRVANAFSDIGHGSKIQTTNGNDTGQGVPSDVGKSGYHSIVSPERVDSELVI